MDGRAGNWGRAEMKALRQRETDREEGDVEEDADEEGTEGSETKGEELEVEDENGDGYEKKEKEKDERDVLSPNSNMVCTRVAWTMRMKAQRQCVITAQRSSASASLLRSEQGK